ncbi:hydantoinase B/oxoprolinase family protein [Arcicella sp. LKC2W]|uniref:hydantoinase B/oxoprolinase family protein n=1 Tax=Arcicella sp. LKC2W TaxID=2984198 RepID=UPI002B21D5DF|nr:hydantoinase B/oxoprolinase family protein [Arcicella sp. LKC2W]MEA5457567.1 hydantoinase B/oxoprolinase family protein [Arcicella sp. LKC2W]
MTKSFQISIDTGGTFTDCIATDNFGTEYRCKILSSSSIRGEVIEQFSANKFKVKQSWLLKRDILKDYLFLILGHNFQASVLSFDIHESTLEIDKSLPEYLQSQVFSFALTANEEAPVLGARLITETALSESFPPIEMRIGSTKGTNALLEMKGAKTAFIVTKGFKDLLVIGNQARPDIFALNIVRPEPLYSLVIEVEEQIDAQGNIIQSLVLDEKNLVQSLVNQDIESVAICLKNAYRNNIHEQQLQETLKKYFKFVNISTELSPQIKFVNRAETTVVNAYLAPIISNYLQNITDKLPNNSLKVMTSAGSLVKSNAFYPKDSLFSGPAGGVVGASVIAKQANYQHFIAFDMGGTSTDVARYDGNFEYQFSQQIGNAQIFSPSLAIETVAAGGGSICTYDGYKLSVGPESAGSMPGPACYGAGGPLTITDVNLLLGRLDATQFSIPVFPEKAEERLQEILQNAHFQLSKEEVLEGFRAIANEKMAETVRKISITKGYDTQDYALVAFGGAGGLHACGIADLLNINTILLPKDAGILSAFGISKAQVERFSEASVLQIFDVFLNSKLEQQFSKLESEVKNKLIVDRISEDKIEIKSRLLYLRFKGQDSSIEVEWTDFEEGINSFKEKYTSIFGHWVENRAIELESIRVIAGEKKYSEQCEYSLSENLEIYFPEPSHFIEAFVENKKESVPVYIRENLKSGAKIKGFALLLDRFSTTIIENDWELVIDDFGTGHITKIKVENTIQFADNQLNNEAAQLELFTNRFMSIAENMGVLLQRTSLSVNVKERLDFSCALLDADAELIANAPHIPVHLGSLGVCVRSVLKYISIEKGDVVITNHPKYGGSHLPDVTLISSVYSDDNQLIGYVVNRCHHSEIGGIRPASMPPYSTNLAEEGVVIPPMYLAKNGEIHWDTIRNVLTAAKYPTRSVEENLADLNAALAANRNGEIALQNLVKNYGLSNVHFYMNRLKEYSTQKMQERLQNFGIGTYEAEEFLDILLDNKEIYRLKVKVEIAQNECVIDFSGSAKTHHGNLNANIAIVNSAVVYVLRLLLNENIPLNDGILKAVKIIIPEKSMLNPDFPDNSEDCPAVVGGNVEVSQRLTDTLLKAFGIVACSQGTMNNFLFGNAKFGYYETICGGSGAGEDFSGTSGVHTHMTNTRITDAEVMELRYPVYLNRFEIRENSGGNGIFKGGNGIVREVTFLEDVEVSLLRQHQQQEPYGISGGENGKVGKHILEKTDGTKFTSNEFSAQKGDKITICTPGGGGFGKA